MTAGRYQEHSDQNQFSSFLKLVLLIIIGEDYSGNRWLGHQSRH